MKRAFLASLRDASSFCPCVPEGRLKDDNDRFAFNRRDANSIDPNPGVETPYTIGMSLRDAFPLHFPKAFRRSHTIGFYPVSLALTNGVFFPWPRGAALF